MSANHPILDTMKCNDCARRDPECSECNGRGWVFAVRLSDLIANWSTRIGPLLIQVSDYDRDVPLSGLVRRARFDGDTKWTTLRRDADLHAQLHHLCRLRTIGAAQ